MFVREPFGRGLRVAVYLPCATIFGKAARQKAQHCRLAYVRGYVEEEICRVRYHLVHDPWERDDERDEEGKIVNILALQVSRTKVVEQRNCCFSTILKNNSATLESCIEKVFAKSL